MAFARTNTVEIPELNRDEEQAVLQLSTNKGTHGIHSYAQVVYRKPGTQIITFEVFGDYRKTIKHERGARGTQKNIDSQHATVFTPESIADLITAAKAHYASK